MVQETDSFPNGRTIAPAFMMSAGSKAVLIRRIAAMRPDVAVPLQKMLLEPADAVLRAKRAAERRGRVVELQRQAAFDPFGELYPVDVGRHQHVVMQIAIADVSIDGQRNIWSYDRTCEPAKSRKR